MKAYVIKWNGKFLNCNDEDWVRIEKATLFFSKVRCESNIYREEGEEVVKVNVEVTAV